MKRSNFLRFLSLGLLAPVFAKAENRKAFPNKIKSSLRTNKDYVLVTHNKADVLMSKDLCDGVVYVEDNDEFFYYQPTTIDVKEFGAIGDGAADDTNALQTAISSCIKNKKTLYLSRPKQSYLSYKKLVIDGQFYMYGDGMTVCGVNFMNSEGFEIAEGVSHVIFERLTINQQIRQTDKPNNFTAVKILGSDKKRPVTHVYRDVFIDGFNTAFKCQWLWDAQFDNVKVLFGKIGMDISGVAVNNNVSDCTIQVSGTDSKAVFFSDAKNPTEGWKFSNLLTFGADYGFYSIYCSNVYVTAPILDFCKKYGVYLESGVGPSTNWQIIGGYIAMSGKDAVAGIALNNNVDNNQIRGCKINNVDIVGYPDSKPDNAIQLKGKYDIKNNIKDNSFTNFKNEVNFLNNKKNENFVQ